MTPEELARAICTRRGLDFVSSVGSGAFKYTFHVKEGNESRALKLYKGGLTERSEREIEAMIRCDHPHIAKFRSLETETVGSDTVSYAFEEFLAGGSLKMRVATIGPDALPRLALPLAGALQHIAGLRLVHRDLKPDNIMFRDRTLDFPVIVDFGLVRNLADTSLTATWLIRGPGTPYFAAPEQLNNEKGMIDWRTDQFGLGVTLAIAWTGQHPYHVPPEPAPATVDRVATWSGPATSFLSRCKDSSLSALARMVEPYPVQRYRTPRELVEAWSRAVQA